MNKHYNLIYNAILRQQNIVFFTGAGISVESGIAPYRGPKGIWSTEYHKLSKMKSRQEFFTFLKEKYQKILSKFPNQTHNLIAQFQAINPNISIITQNVDQLHQKAGSPRVLELHGNFAEMRCDSCYTFVESSVSVCPKCGGLIRPNIVWFGENINPRTIQKAVQLTNQAAIFISLGTSSHVYPATNLIFLAKDKGIPVYEINPTPTGISEYLTFQFSVSSSVFLSNLMEKYLDFSRNSEKSLVS